LWTTPAFHRVGKEFGSDVVQELHRPRVTEALEDRVGWRML
jgi:hypothetical protein